VAEDLEDHHDHGAGGNASFSRHRISRPRIPKPGFIVKLRLDVHGNVGEEPGAAAGTPAVGEGELFVVRAGGKEPGAGVAEGLAGIGGEVGREFLFTPLAGPAEFTAGGGGELRFEDGFPGGAAGIAESNPGEMEEFVGENTRTLRRVAAERGVEVNFAAEEVGAAESVAVSVAKIRIPDEPNRSIFR